MDMRADCDADIARVRAVLFLRQGKRVADDARAFPPGMTDPEL